MKSKKTPTQKLAKELEKISHDYIRRRDSKDKDFIGGNCFDCGVWCEGANFQCGHFEASGASGALLRYHPFNMHGQFSGCNMHYSQERVKIAYTLKMVDKFGREYVDYLRSLRHKTIKADSIFYSKMIDLYTAGDEKAIVAYLDSLV